jgi:hypothetical protein
MSVGRSTSMPSARRAAACTVSQESTCGNRYREPPYVRAYWWANTEHRTPGRHQPPSDQRCAGQRIGPPQQQQRARMIGFGHTTGRVRPVDDGDPVGSDQNVAGVKVAVTQAIPGR